jgi:hypothetical protein
MPLGFKGGQAPLLLCSLKPRVQQAFECRIRLSCTLCSLVQVDGEGLVDVLLRHVAVQLQ